MSTNVSSNFSRRQWLQAAGQLAAVGLTGAATGHAAEQPVLGLIFPSGTNLPYEAKTLYPSGVTFLADGVGLERMAPDDYDRVSTRIEVVAQRLAKQGATAIAIMGTSLTFFKGAAFNQSLIDGVRKATGLPCTSMSTAIVEGLRAVGGHRLAVATAYADDVNERLRTFLKESGFEVLTLQGLGIVDLGDLRKVTQPALLEFSAGVREKAPAADALLISCGGLHTLELIAPLEQRCKVPVVSSLPHAFRSAVRLVGNSGKAKGFGRLLEG